MENTSHANYRKSVAKTVRKEERSKCEQIALASLKMHLLFEYISYEF